MPSRGRAEGKRGGLGSTKSQAQTLAPIHDNVCAARDQPSSQLGVRLTKTGKNTITGAWVEPEADQPCFRSSSSNCQY